MRACIKQFVGPQQINISTLTLHFSATYTQLLRSPCSSLKIKEILIRNSCNYGAYAKRLSISKQNTVKQIFNTISKAKTIAKTKKEIK